MTDIEFERQLQQIREGKLPRITADTACSGVARKHINELSRYVRALEEGYNTAMARAEIHERCKR